MNKDNTKAPCSILEDKQLKLFDFFEEFSEYESYGEKLSNGCLNSDDNLIRLTKHGNFYFKYKYAFCPDCYSSNVVKNGNYVRKLYFLNVGEQKCIIQKYKCKKCGKIFYTDIKSIVDENCNITKPVIEYINEIYSVSGNSIYKIQYMLKRFFNVDISHQSIESCIISDENDDISVNESYSGYYLFDSLWTKINCVWNYFLVLFDVKLNSVVSMDLVESEDIGTIYKFLDDSLRNQPKICIVSDLKDEYHPSIEKVGVRHQFCMFHTKQKINRNIREDKKRNNYSNEELEYLNYCKQLVFDVLDANDLESAKKGRNYLISIQNNLPKVIFNLLWFFIIPYFKTITFHLENSNVPTTSNKIENFFQKVFPKHIKKTLRTFEGARTRFSLKTKYWVQRNFRGIHHQSY